MGGIKKYSVDLQTFFMRLLRVTLWEPAINYNQEMAQKGQELKQGLEGETLSSFPRTRAHAEYLVQG